VEDEYAEFTMNELINGKGAEFPGLIGLVYSYLDSLNIDVETRCEMALYLDLVSKRASGECCRRRMCDAGPDARRAQASS
jgi:glutamate--cysteine ligase catalytic subunit